MSEKIPVLIADDLKLDRSLLKASFRRLAPELDVSEHSQGATLLGRLLKFKSPPRLLILDRALTQGQRQRTSECLDATILALRIRKDYPQLDAMAILMFSRWTLDEEAAEFTERCKSEGIWSRSKAVSHKLLVRQIRNEILSQWPKRKVKRPGQTGPAVVAVGTAALAAARKVKGPGHTGPRRGK
jgi:hypothetical protein